MSSIFSISSVTNAGIAAMQEALDHGYTMVFTAMKTGNGVYTTGEDVTGRTALKSLKNTYTIGSIEEDTDGATVSAVFTNYDGVNILVAEDYKINEIGLFCTVNSVEYLYALAAVPNDDGMEMPAYDVDAENLTQFIQEWYVANSNHANIAVNPVGAYIPVTDIVDNLTSNSTTKPLSAKQGKVLNDAKQPKTLSSPITIGGTSQTTVEGALGGLNTVKAERADITSISCTGATNDTGATITNGSRFYLNGALCRATADIANGATFTLNTNFKVITVDEELAELNSNLSNKVDMSHVTNARLGGGAYFGQDLGIWFTDANNNDYELLIDDGFSRCTKNNTVVWDTHYINITSTVSQRSNTGLLEVWQCGRMIQVTLTSNGDTWPAGDTAIANLPRAKGWKDAGNAIMVPMMNAGGTGKIDTNVWLTLYYDGALYVQNNSGAVAGGNARGFILTYMCA